MKKILISLAVLSLLLLFGCNSTPKPKPSVVFQVVPSLQNNQISSDGSTQISFSITNQLSTANNATITFTHDPEITIKPLGLASYETFTPASGGDTFVTEVGGQTTTTKNFEVKGKLTSGVKTDYPISIGIMDQNGLSGGLVSLTLTIVK